MLSHLSADVGQHLVLVGQFDPEHGVRESLHNGALHFDHAFFLRHVSQSVGAFIYRFDPGTAHQRIGGGPRKLSWNFSQASEV